MQRGKFFDKLARKDSFFPCTDGDYVLKKPFYVTPLIERNERVEGSNEGEKSKVGRRRIWG